MGNVDKCINDVDASHHEVYANDVDNLDEALGGEGALTTNYNYEFVESCSYSIIPCAPTLFDPFIVCKVKKKDGASSDIIDFYGHTVIKGDKYVQVCT